MMSDSNEVATAQRLAWLEHQVVQMTERANKLGAALLHRIRVDQPLHLVCLDHREDVTCDFDGWSLTVTWHHAPEQPERYAPRILAPAP
jgi:hypothetical protein